mgnify:FL=1
MENLNQIISLLKESKSQFHVVNNIRETLLSNGYKQIKEEDEITSIGDYFYIRGGSSIVVININSMDPCSKIIAAHTDSPTFKLKQNPNVADAKLNRLNVEPYGGAIYYPFFDRPLGVAGRAFFKKDNKVEQVLIDLDASFIIPSLAIHMDRNVNSSFSPNPKSDLLPLYGTEEDADISTYINNRYKDNGELLSYDLFLYNKVEPTLTGLNKEFLSSSRLDDLASVYSSLLGLISSKNKKGCNIAIYFDSEEVGSSTFNGADSDLLSFTFDKLSSFYKVSKIKLARNSFCISADNAHAIHPAHIDLTDRSNQVYLNSGVAIKYNANMAYTSDAYSSSFIKEMFNKAKLNYQEFSNRSDLRGGSTLGNISSTQISLHTVDIGIPQLAMHSCYETLGVNDLLDMVKLAATFYSSMFSLKEDGFQILGE